MNLLQRNELVRPLRHTHHKVERGIAAVHKLEGALFNDVAHFGSPWQHIRRNVSQNTSLFRFRV
jgi:hypothetical protein